MATSLPTTSAQPPKPPTIPTSGLIQPVYSTSATQKLADIGLTPDDVSTQSRVTNMIQQNSPLMQQAETKALQQMNGRGLLNSSMAGTSALDAVLGRATEIANPDADRITGVARAAQEIEANRARQAEQFGQQEKMFGLMSAEERAQMQSQFGQQEKMFGLTSAEERARQEALFGQQKEMFGLGATQDTAQQQALFDQQVKMLGLDEASRLRLQSADLANRKELTQMELDARRAMSSEQFAQQLQLVDKQIEASLQTNNIEATRALQTAYRTATQATYDSYLADVSRINASEMTMEAKTAQISNLNGLYTTRQQFVNQLYAAMPQWQDEWSQIGVEFGVAG